MKLWRDRSKTASVSTIHIEVAGVMKSGARFTMEFPIQFDQQEQTAEKAIIEHFGSGAGSFEELVIQQGWSSGNWYYAPTYYIRQAVTI